MNFFLRAYTDIFSNNIKQTRDFTYNNLKNIINNKNVTVMGSDKDSSVVILDHKDYMYKLETMVTDGIKNGTYIKTQDRTIKYLKRFQQFLYRNFKNYEKYHDLLPT